VLDDLLKRLGAMPEDARKEIEGIAAAVTSHMRFVPNPGAQTMAYLSEADILLYGGAAGGGKSALMVGLAANEHRRSIILRRESVEVDGIEAFAKEVMPDAGFNGTDLEFSWSDRSLKLGGCKDADSWRKYAGRARDFMGFDEAGEFLEEQVASLIAWNRSPDVSQRCRVVLGSNPPRGADGLWLGEWFAPWLDPLHPNPAAPGDLRWAIRVKGELRWVDGPEPVTVDGEEYRPLSYTFIPAKLADNPYNDTPEYRARLQSLPEPLRSQLLHGDFRAGREDDEWQVIPSEHIRAAQERWREPGRAAMLSLGVDVAQGGPDRTVLAPLHVGNIIGRLIDRRGIDTKDGPTVASLILKERRDGALIAIDTTGGWGGSARDHLKTNNDIAAVAVVFGAASHARDKATGMDFGNLRAEMYWDLRTALEPSSGENLALPPGEDVLAHLAASQWFTRNGKIWIESKDDIRKRLGVSPDKADAIVMAWHVRRRAIRNAQTRTIGTAASLPSRANVGHTAIKAYRR
jgi:hypothetical protein